VLDGKKKSSALPTNLHLTPFRILFKDNFEERHGWVLGGTVEQKAVHYTIETLLKIKKLKLVNISTVPVTQLS